MKEEPEADFKCNDKFLIVSLPSPYDLGENKVAEVWPKLEAEFKSQSVSQKIKVKYLFNKAEEPIEEIKEKEEEPIVEDSERNKIDELNEKLDSNVAKSSSKPASVNQKQVTTSSSTPITTVLLIALIAFIIGWLFF